MYQSRQLQVFRSYTLGNRRGRKKERDDAEAGDGDGPGPPDGSMVFAKVLMARAIRLAKGAKAKYIEKLFMAAVKAWCLMKYLW